MTKGVQVNSNVINVVAIPSIFNTIDKATNYQRPIIALALVSNGDGTQDFMGVGKDGLLYPLRSV
jgi:hypothetical protein